MKADSAAQTVTGIVPTYGNPEYLRRCLLAFAASVQGVDVVDLLVIDNSRERDQPIVHSVVQNAGNPLVKYVAIEPEGLMVARHVGAAQATGDVLAFLDDDSLVRPGWCEAVKAAFSAPDLGIAAGRCLPLFEAEPPAWLESFWSEREGARCLAHLSLLDCGSARRGLPPGWYVLGCNMAVRRDLFFEARGTHPDYLPDPYAAYQGDGETALAVKLAAMGFPTVYVPNMAIDHCVPAKRMTWQYFGDRSFFNGLHTEFTQIRREHGFGPRDGVPIVRNAPNGFSRKLLRKVRSVPRRVLGRAPLIPAQSRDAREVQEWVRSRFLEGRLFLSEAAAGNPDLLAYILRPDYMGDNARLPHRGESDA